MEVFKLSDMVKGWFVGSFEPNVLHSPDWEVGIKYYKAGDYEPKHVHKVAVELTAIVYGRVLMNDTEYKAGDIVKINPGVATDFRVLEDTCTVVVKNPSVTNDKYVL
ncbi:hypothetical protein B9G69_014765 [Bdellovibrio sp. SKB1291214]|uniref:hypothetical protein n=1 Tax=Bdellovibrio sp. SKB1291214 TaxID=1732569 RepID=UPI000B51A6CA|nr:hypothetical protein [Bdellovibrio sp. SKB1291214]UYL08301.1 hypothetical protein B9G69_014765 [Bdellovibrio sp. SKB1291214]